MFSTNNSFMNKTFLTLLAACLALGACTGNDKTATTDGAQLGWPEVTRTTKPWTRWWWPASAVGKSDIDTMLQDYQTANLGGMEVTTIYGVRGSEDKFLEYLTPEWMDLFTYTLEEADKRDMGIDLANASGWPFGGPWVTPDYACRYLAYKTYDLKGGESLDEKVEFIQEPILRTVGKKANWEDMKFPVVANDDLQEYAFDQVRYPVPLPLMAITATNKASKETIDLTSKMSADGKLDWTAPEGDWQLCAMFLGWHGKMVERAGPGGEGDVIDHFSGEAIERYLKKFDEAFKGYDVSKIRYYFNDSYEVDDAQGDSDWTENFFEEFKARRGYDLLPHMTTFLGLDGNKDEEARLLFDYRTTIGELLLEKYSTLWQKWAAAQGKGIRNQAHGSPANIMDLYGVSDVPETEGRSIVGMKTASSAAHVTDKPLTSCEAATWLNEHFMSTLGDVKTSIDTYLLSGVNHVFYHGTCLSPDDAIWPGWLFYAAVHFQPTNSFWTDFGEFNNYVTRCQSFLQAGKPDNDILLFFDSTDLLSEGGQQRRLFHMSQHTPVQSAIGKTATYLYDKGYTWDFISDKMVQESVDAKKGNIVTKGGAVYKTIIVPECDKMVFDTFQKLMNMAKKGATIMVEHALPGDVPGLSDLESNRAALKKLKESLKFSTVNGVQVAKCGKGYVYVSDDLDAMFTLAGISREKMYALGLQCISRVKEDGGKYYFIKNASAQTVCTWVPVDDEFASAGIYNPMSGEFGYGKVRKADDGSMEVFMKLVPDESILLETFKAAGEGAEYKFYEACGDSDAVSGEWVLNFTKGGPVLPASKSLAATGSWTSYGKDYEIFSGSGTYTTTLPAREGAEAYVIDLGDVHESAAVYFNGEYLGTVFKKPYAVKLSAEQAAKGGQLQVVVSNSMENRIADMDRKGIEWRIFYNANIQARLPQDRGKDGFFTAAGWGVKPSGLIGPVTVTPVKGI